MSFRRIGIASAAALVLAAASVIGFSGAASGAVSAVHSTITVHVAGSTVNPRVLFNFPTGDLGAFAESMVADRDGNLFVSVTAWGDATCNKGQIWKITPRGVVTKYGPELNVGLLTGLALDESGRLYAGLGSCGDPSLPSGVLRIDVRSFTQVLTLPADVSGVASFPNGLAFHDGTLYVSDSTVGAIWRTRPRGNINDSPAKPWLQRSLLAPSSPYALGINGIAIDSAGIEAVVADSGLAVRIPIMRNGTPGTLVVIAKDPALVNADGVTLASDGSLWVATNGTDNDPVTGRIVKVSPRGRVTVVVENPGWLDYPTQLVFGTTCATEDTLYITNGVYYNLEGVPNVIAWRPGKDALH